MEIIATIGLLVSPVIIRYLTEGLKMLRNVQLSENRVFILRFFVALMSLGVSVGNSLLNGSDFDTTIIDQFAQAVLIFLSSTGLYYWQKYKMTTIQG